MADHFLKDCVTGEPGFKAEAFYNPYGDCVDYQSVDEAICADRLDSLITLYRSAVDGRVIGFQIKGIKAILGALGFETMAVGAKKEADQSISLIVLVLAACKLAEEKEARKDQLEALSSLFPEIADQNVSIPLAA
jgi:hypothetical protein